MVDLDKYSDSTVRLIQELGVSLLKEHCMLYPENVISMSVLKSDDEVFVIYSVQPES